MKKQVKQKSKEPPFQGEFVALQSWEKIETAGNDTIDTRVRLQGMIQQKNGTAGNDTKYIRVAKYIEFSHVMNMSDVAKTFTDVFIRVGSSQTVDHVLADVGDCCDLFCQVVLELRRMNSSKLCVEW